MCVTSDTKSSPTTQSDTHESYDTPPNTNGRAVNGARDYPHGETRYDGPHPLVLQRAALRHAIDELKKLQVATAELRALLEAQL